MRKVLIPTKLDKVVEKILSEHGFTVVQNPDVQLADLASENSDASAIIVRSEKVTPEIMDGLKDLKLVVRAGAGFDNIDIRHARKLGIDVMNTPGANSNAVAEEVIALILAAYRKLIPADQSTRAGKWEKKSFMGRELTGKTVGILGLGNIGRLLIKRLSGFDVKILAYDPILSADLAAHLGAQLCTVEEVFAQSDIVSLHIPENDKTRGMINAKLLGLMKNGAMLVNCARAGIVDEAAIRAKAEDILNTFDIEGGATVETVWDMAKYVVAFEQWCKDEQLGFVASHYDGFAQGVAGKLDSMLIPAFSMLIKQGTACAVEGDIKVAMAMGILKTIAGTGQLSEMYSIDFNEDICIIGHSGSGDADISQARKPTMKIVPVFHGKTGGGYLTQFYPPTNEAITFLGITQDRDGHFKFVVAEGVNEEGPIFMFGDTNMRMRFTCGARDFCNRWSEAGPTHHMAAAVGRHIDTILKVAKIFNVPVDIITR